MQYTDPRQVPRYHFSVDIEMTDVESGIHIRARTRDLSLFGCGVATLKIFSKGTNLRIKLSHGGADVKAFARVVYASPDLGLGVAFTSVEHEDERTLDWWIAELMACDAVI